MVDKPLLIVGVDPGTTVGYAAIDLEGKPIDIASGKNLDRDTIIKKLVEIGKPLIIAGDKEKNPDFLESISIKVGAKIISPDYDLKIVEKREIAKNIETSNQHQIDALASALFALKKIGSVLKKIDVYVGYHKKEAIKSELIELVVSKELNIKDAAELLRQPEKEDERIIKKVVDQKPITEQDFFALYEKYHRSRKDMSLLQTQNAKLRNTIKRIRRDNNAAVKKLTKQNTNRRMNSLLHFKEERLKSFERKIKGKEQLVDDLKTNISTLLFFLSSVGDHMLLKKLDNLGSEEYERKRPLLHIQQGDLLLVKDPELFSQKVVNELQGDIDVIISKKPLTKKAEEKLPFVFLKAEDLPIEESEYFAVVSKSDFSSIKEKKNVLAKMIENYKRDRI